MSFCDATFRGMSVDSCLHVKHVFACGFTVVLVMCNVLLRDSFCPSARPRQCFHIGGGSMQYVMLREQALPEAIWSTQHSAHG